MVSVVGLGPGKKIYDRNTLQCVKLLYLRVIPTPCGLVILFDNAFIQILDFEIVQFHYYNIFEYVLRFLMLFKIFYLLNYFTVIVKSTYL